MRNQSFERTSKEKLDLLVSKSCGDEFLYKDKLDRRQRIVDKRKQIEGAIDANGLRFFWLWGYKGPGTG